MILYNKVNKGAVTVSEDFAGRLVASGEWSTAPETPAKPAADKHARRRKPAAKKE